MPHSCMHVLSSALPIATQSAGAQADDTCHWLVTSAVLTQKLDVRVQALTLGQSATPA